MLHVQNLVLRRSKEESGKTWKRRRYLPTTDSGKGKDAALDDRGTTYWPEKSLTSREKLQVQIFAGCYRCCMI